jgi:hypothetical protein
LLTVKEIIQNFYDILHFQRAINGTERAAYEKLIAPFMNDMPKSFADGLKRVCGGRKYAHIGANLFITLESNTLSCQVV